MHGWLAISCLMGLVACAPKPAPSVRVIERPVVAPGPVMQTREVPRGVVVRVPLPPARPQIRPVDTAHNRPAVTQDESKPIRPAQRLKQPKKTAHGSSVPPGARRYAPLLAEKQATIWPKVPDPWTLGGLVEQESCVSLRSRRCWNPRAQLKTYREYGFGFGQITIAYNRNGSERFNKFKELKREYASLHAWRWDDRFNPGYQLAAVVEMVHGLWHRMPPAHDATSHWAFTLSSYNGGRGGLLQDRRYCANSRHCDPTRWFGNVETHSLKSRVPHPAYGGQSWYSINRGYVRNVLKIRRAKYRQFWD